MVNEDMPSRPDNADDDDNCSAWYSFSGLTAKALNQMRECLEETLMEILSAGGTEFLKLTMFRNLCDANYADAAHTLKLLDVSWNEPEDKPIHSYRQDGRNGGTLGTLCLGTIDQKSDLYI